jgi:hypothetical protein
MTKLLTNREMELFILAMPYCHRYHECNPDVGWASSVESIAREVVNKLSFDIDEDDIAECCEEITGA